MALDDGTRRARPRARPDGPRRPVVVLEGVIARARRGDQTSFDQIYRVYHPLLQRHLELTCGPRADDVAAATWASVVQSIGSFVGDGHDFRRWLFTIARRRLVDDIRRSSRQPAVVAEPRDDDVSVDFSSPLESVEWVESALASLPVRQAEVLSLRIIGGLDVVAVARLLELSPENVRVLSHRGLSALRASFERSGENFTRRSEKSRRNL